VSREEGYGVFIPQPTMELGAELWLKTGFGALGA